MPKEMVEAEEHVNGFEVRLPALGIVEEMEAVAKRILHDGVARICLEQYIHLNGLASLFDPVQYLFGMFPDHGLKFADASNGEEGIDDAAALAVHVVVFGGGHRVWSWEV